jgi:hypothetical protein
MNYYKSALVFSLEDDNYYSALGVYPSIHLLKNKNNNYSLTNQAMLDKNTITT